ncbi:glutathione S-transferase [Limnohabitans sp. T6-20]|uniref:glutathione S-transferase n=1 Tax=Limnohabitans sp. T6-20 TaxID=1100725 RepID=UPI000D385F6D|nr:glutathione S-transferase [Limnohabitans sp. T6-20]PUE09891.1 glutathione S-transferase [Limnohabitans sp. T6-20]
MPSLSALPVLYSFRRCPYAMRARLALHASGLAHEHREVVLKNKPAHMLALSPKGTVPVLWLPGSGAELVLEQSMDIMLWALRQHDPLGWLPSTDAALVDALALIAHNDGPFKQQLDRYKYPNRSGLERGHADRDGAAVWLLSLDALLQAQPFLASEHWGLADAAIAPFVRQFAHTDPHWFAAQPWPRLLAWLTEFEASEMFEVIMHKHVPWQEGT